MININLDLTILNEVLKNSVDSLNEIKGVREIFKIETIKIKIYKENNNLFSS